MRSGSSFGVFLSCTQFVSRVGHERGGGRHAPRCPLVFHHAGGAIAQVPRDATAFAQRSSLANMLFFIEWPLAESPQAHVAYIREQ